MLDPVVLAKSLMNQLSAPLQTEAEVVDGWTAAFREYFGMAETLGGPTVIEQGVHSTPGNAKGVWGDGTYIYVANGGSGISAYTFNGSTFTEKGTHSTPGYANGIWCDRNYIYVADGDAGIVAYTFNGTTFTQKGIFNTPGTAIGVWGDGTYIYVADGDSGIRAYTFNGTTFTEKGHFDTPASASGVCGDGTYIYVADQGSGSRLRAYTFDGTTFTEKGIFARGDAWGVFCEGGYIYLAAGGAGVGVYTFDGTNFTERVLINTPGDARSVWVDRRHPQETNVYVADEYSGIRVYTVDGTTFVERGAFDTPGRAWSVWGDGNYVYLADNLPSTPSSIRAYIVRNNYILTAYQNYPLQAFKIALENISHPGEAAGKIMQAVQSFWFRLRADPSMYFTDSIDIFYPAAISKLQENLTTVFDANTVSTSSPYDAYLALAQKIHEANLGGFMSLPGSPPKNYPIF